MARLHPAHEALRRLVSEGFWTVPASRTGERTRSEPSGEVARVRGRVPIVFRSARATMAAFARRSEGGTVDNFNPRRAWWYLGEPALAAKRPPPKLGRNPTK